MTMPCCVVFDYSIGQVCGYTNTAEECRNFPGALEPGKPGPEGAGCLDPCTIEPCCWSCFPTFPEPGTEFDCCYPNEQYRFTWPSNCDRCGGQLGVTEEECAPPPEPAGCRTASQQEILPQGGKRWTLDLNGTVAIGMDAEPDNSVPDTSYVQGLSATLTRAVDTPNSSPEDPCGHIRGDSVLLDDGYVYTELCSQPIHNEAISRRRTYAVLRTAEGVPPSGPGSELIEGYQYAVGAVRLPYWTEFMYRSSEWRCRSPE